MKKLLLTLGALLTAGSVLAGCSSCDQSKSCGSCKTTRELVDSEKPVCQKMVPVTTCPEAHEVTTRTYTCPPDYTAV